MAALFEYPDPSLGLGRDDDTAQGEPGAGSVLFSESAFRRLFESAPFGMALRQAEGARYAGVNQVFAKILARSRETISGRTAGDFLHPDDMVNDSVLFGRLLRGEIDGHRIQRRYLRPDGEVRWVSATLTALSETMVLEMAEDVTEVRRSREAIREREAALAHATRLATLGEMAAGIAHEVNQPLAAIVNYANGSLRRLSGATPEIEPVLQALGNISRQAMRASEIVRRLKRLSRREDGDRDDADLNSITRSVIALLEAELLDEHIQISLELAEEIPPVRVDLVQIEQVALNLLRNAMEALKDCSGPRWITITTAVDAENVRLSVADNGIGLEYTLMEKVFDAFFTTKKSGLGMGLSISRTIVEKHRGRLWAEPGSPQGAVFHLSLPIFGDAR